MRDAILSLYDTGGSSTNWVLFDDLRRELILQINTVFTCANGDTNELVNRLTNHVIGHCDCGITYYREYQSVRRTDHCESSQTKR